MRISSVLVVCAAAGAMGQSTTARTNTTTSTSTSVRTSTASSSRAPSSTVSGTSTSVKVTTSVVPAVVPVATGTGVSPPKSANATSSGPVGSGTPKPVTTSGAEKGGVSLVVLGYGVLAGLGGVAFAFL